MKWLRQFRKSAFFIDFILIMAAIIAILGLATFVRFHKGKTPSVATTTESLHSAYEKAEALSAVNEDGSPNSNDQPSGNTKPKVEGANTVQPSGCDSNCNLSNQTLVPTNDFPAAPACNQDKKKSLENSYNEAVNKENNRYQIELRSKRGSLLGGVTQTLDSLVKALEPAHLKILNDLNANLQRSLSAANC